MHASPMNTKLRRIAMPGEDKGKIQSPKQMAIKLCNIINKRKLEKKLSINDL